MSESIEYKVKFNQLKFTKSGNDLIISSKKFKKNQVLKDFFTLEDPIDLIKTTDSKVAHSLLQDMKVYVSSVQNENGEYVADGTKYQDIITGTKYDDTITGGQGNDVITSGQGSDTFIFNIGDGVDTIKDADKSDAIHINTGLNNLVYTRVKNNLEISYSDDDKIVLTNFFKNKSENNVDLIKNLSGETQLEYEDYINNPPYYESYYLNQYQKIYILKVFMSIDGYELCEKSILKDATIQIGEKRSYTGTDYNETVIATGKNGAFNMGKGNDVITFGENYGKSVVTVNKDENLNLRFSQDVDFTYSLSGSNLIMKSADGNVITLKDYLKAYNDSTVKINGKRITTLENFMEMLKHDASDFVNGKFTGTVLDDNIDASGLVMNKKKSTVTINSKSGNDKIIGSKYNDIINVESLAGETTSITENAGDNTITTGLGTNNITVTGFSSNKITTTGGKNNITLSNMGVNNIYGGEGKDYLTITSGINNVNMGDGHNRAIVSGGNNRITGGAGNDEVKLSGGKNVVNTGDSYDIVTVMGGSNTINMGAGNDKLIYYSGTSTTIDGGEGNDTYDFMNYEFGSHVNITDTEGENRLLFSEMTMYDAYEEVLDNGMVIGIARMGGNPYVFFDVTIDENGQGVAGNDVLFTSANKFTGFGDNGVYVADKSAIASVEGVYLAALYYSTGPSNYLGSNISGYEIVDLDEPYNRPNWGVFSNSRYHLNFDELTEKVATWLTSDANDSGYTSAMDVFTNGTDSQIAQLTSIYIRNVDCCYEQYR
ncbi:MAG: hypothetical protein K6E29_09000 [Cyanobacteria bacterium RUI128]|nr:hypothetical protein [Cyanobacteria bacterium RUI128]